ncbi:MAG TPA: DUF1800 family protein [Acidimicrobiales bacterium]|nr:DUF1800 family protein [Acidimicrobiales bacterium]
MAASSEALVAHVWRRLGFGPAPGDVEAGVAAGGAGAVIDELLARPATTLADWQWPVDQGVWQDAVYWLNHMFLNWAQSPGQVQERVSWILAGLLVVGANDVVQYADYKDHHARLRGWCAAGSYKALLNDVANSGPMQKYLTNVFSVPPHPNQNLAREIMELFSLGVTHAKTGANNYTQTDIEEIARALTGYVMDWNTGAVSFATANWDSGTKTFLGAARGAAQLSDVVDAITQQDAFRYFVPKRLYREFMGFDPSTSAMDDMAAVWGTSGDIAGLVSHIAHRPEFLADTTVGNRVKSPVELLVSQMRVLGVQNIDDWSVLWTSQTMRQNPILPPDVSGWDNMWLHPTQIVQWARYNYWYTWHDTGPDKDTATDGTATPPEKQNPTVRKLYAEATRATAADMALQLAGLHDVSSQTRSAIDAYAQATDYGASEPWSYARACGVMQLVFDSPEFMVS